MWVCKGVRNQPEFSFENRSTDFEFLPLGSYYTHQTQLQKMKQIHSLQFPQCSVSEHQDCR